MGQHVHPRVVLQQILDPGFRYKMDCDNGNFGAIFVSISVGSQLSTPVTNGSCVIMCCLFQLVLNVDIMIDPKRKMRVDYLCRDQRHGATHAFDRGGTVSGSVPSREGWESKYSEDACCITIERCRIRSPIGERFGSDSCTGSHRK